jgi:four helix bundle protein
MDSQISGYKKLAVFQKAYGLTKAIYKLTSNFPKSEIFGLSSQMRRCAISISTNIAEGYGRRTKKDKLQFYYIARGSLNELECYIDLVLDLDYCNQKEYDAISAMRTEIGKLLYGFIKYTEK